MTEGEDIRGKIDAENGLHEVIAPNLPLLNALNGDYSQWHRTSGKNDYVDAFGATIPAGRAHYRKGGDYVNCVRLSALSMSRFIDVFFLDNHLGFKLATDLRAASIRRMAEAMNTVSLKSKPDSQTDP